VISYRKTLFTKCLIELELKKRENQGVEVSKGGGWEQGSGRKCLSSKGGRRGTFPFREMGRRRGGSVGSSEENRIQLKWGAMVKCYSREQQHVKYMKRSESRTRGALLISDDQERKKHVHRGKPETNGGGKNITVLGKRALDGIGEGTESWTQSR